MHAAIRQSAHHLREAGFDGLMLHGSHAGLIEQFLSPYFNERTDEYGGSLENRMHFLIESLQAAREGAVPRWLSAYGSTATNNYRAATAATRHAKSCARSANASSSISSTSMSASSRSSSITVCRPASASRSSTGIAELLARSGAKVVYVSAGFSPLSPRLIDAFEARHVVQRLKSVGVQFAPTTWVCRIDAKRVTVYDIQTEEERTLEADAVVLSTGRVPQDSLARALDGKVEQLFIIGDALAARPLATATYEGQKFARLIGEPGAPATTHEAYFRADDPIVNPLPADVPRR